jgi:lipopolysaccharide/colanic/teichoic acid biosynthesis glycosyltransferase
MKRLYLTSIKFIIDILIALTVLLLLFPVIFILIISLYFANKGFDVFFTQTRPGKNAKLFKIIKFKTMTDERDAQGKLLHDKYRITKIGKFIRATSLDELPQLINVLKGEMSLVGPRPLLPKYIPLYNERQARRHDVKPGITGWTQVNGRNSISWKEKFEMDVWYVDNISFALDMKILFLTLLKVLKREGINAADSVSGVPFKGNDMTLS